MRRRRKSAALAVLSLVAMGGFVGLLIVAQHDAESAIALRALAIVWLMAFGAVKLLVDFSREV